MSMSTYSNHLLAAKTSEEINQCSKKKHTSPLPSKTNPPTPSLPKYCPNLPSFQSQTLLRKLMNQE